MTRFRSEILERLYKEYQRTLCLDWEDKDHAQAVWLRVCGSVAYPKYRDMVLDAGGEDSQGKPGAIHAVAVSPDGSRIISAGWDGLLRVWDAATGREVRRCRGHSRPVWCVAFSPDGDRIASNGEDGTVRIWDALTGAERMRLRTAPEGFEQAVYSVRFSPDGDRIAAGGYDGKLRVWNSKTGKLVCQPIAADRIIWSISFSPDGSKIATAGDSGKIALWNAATLEREERYQGHEGGRFA